MTKIETQIPDALYTQVKQLAERENIPLDQLVTIALTAQVSAWMTKDYLETRAARGSWQSAREVLAHVPDADPLPHDAPQKYKPEEARDPPTRLPAPRELHA